MQLLCIFAEEEEGSSEDGDTQSIPGCMQFQVSDDDENGVAGGLGTEIGVRKDSGKGKKRHWAAEEEEESSGEEEFVDVAQCRGTGLAQYKTSNVL